MIAAATNKSPCTTNIQFPQYNYVKNILILAAIYALSAKLGLFFAISNGSVTMLWPPSGIALAALIIYGMRLWPGVFIGAFIANIWSTGDFIASLGMSAGSTLSTVLAIWLITALIGRRNPLASVSNLYKFFAVAFISPSIAACVGPTMLILNDLANLDSYNTLCLTWWIGDTVGILVFAPFVLAWQKNVKPPLLDTPNYFEISLFTILLIIVSLLPLISALPAEIIGYPIAFISFPFCAWAAYRYSMKQVTITLIIIMALAVYTTAAGYGPFYQATLNESLFQLQMFMAVTVITTLSLASAVFERKNFEMQLITQKKHAEKLTDAKSQFMSSMSHELRTPLNAIIGFSHILQQDKATLNTQQHEFIGYISDAGNHLLHLVNDLLDIEQNDAHKLNIETDKIKIHESILESILFIEHITNKRNITVHYDRNNDDELFVLADEIRLRQVLINILSNAAKYNNDDGSITVVCTKLDTFQTSIAITDTGNGINEKNIEKIFEPFNRAQIESSRIEGSGIGLTVAHKLVQLMHGEILVTSDVGKGSTFTIILPSE